MYIKFTDKHNARDLYYIMNDVGFCYIGDNKQIPNFVPWEDFIRTLSTTNNYFTCSVLTYEEYFLENI